MFSSSVKSRPDPSGSPDRQSNSARSSPSRAGKQEEGDIVSDSSSVQSGEAADRRDVDILTQVLSSRSEEYRLLFRLPADEVLIQDFNCALQENILLQGHMYLFVHHICFYSNIFGFETKRIISFHEITCIRKAKTAAIFHNAIEIAAGEKKHFYGSFLSRDEAYRLIVDAWSQHNAEVRAILEVRQDSKSEGTGQDWINISDREHDLKQQTNGLISEDSITTKIPEIFENEEADGVCPSSEEVLHWQLQDADAPNVPEYFLMVAEAKFMVGLEDFFNLFFSDDASNFLENLHKACGDKDFQCSRWHRHGETGRDRDMTFQHPIKIYFGAKFGQCHEIQKLHAYRNGHLVIKTSQQVSDVPYGDYFHVQGLWDVEEVNGGHTCILRVHVNVAFSRKTMWKGKIEQSTREEYREVSEIWIKNAHELLKQKNLEKQDLPGSIGLVTEIAENNLAGLKSIPTLEEFSGNIHISNSHTARIEMPSTSHSFLIEGRKFATSMLLSLKESLANIHAYLKSHSNISPMWIVAFLCVIVLMQLCVIALLARKPEVHVISEGSYMNGLAADRPEIIDWFEKRVLSLNEEMLMLDNRLQRMHHEYTLLKEHLHVLQQSRRKS